MPNIIIFIHFIDIPEPRDVPALVHEMWKNDDTMMQEFPQRRNYDTKILLQSSPVCSTFYIQPIHLDYTVYMLNVMSKFK